MDKKICNNVDTFLKSDCLKRADPGPCAAFRQFYGYDEQTDTCKEFHFGGCRGNRNKDWITNNAIVSMISWNVLGTKLFCWVTN